MITKNERISIIDGLRGYLIFAMTVGHFVAITGFSWLSLITHKPFSVFLTGEGFMAVSGFMSGFVLASGFSRRKLKGSIIWGLKRSLKIFFYYLIVFALCVFPSFFVNIEDRFASILFYSRTEFNSYDIVSFILGFFRPSFFDILYLYIVFLFIAPIFVWLYVAGLRYILLSLSFFLWLTTQYGFTGQAMKMIFEDFFGISLNEAGAFHLFAWQFLYFFAAAFGILYHSQDVAIKRWIGDLPPSVFNLMSWLLFSFSLVGVASVFGILHLGTRYLQDYLVAAPLPLLNFILTSIVVAHIVLSPRFLKTWMQLLLLKFLLFKPFRIIGSMSLQSFSASIVLSYWFAYTIKTEAPVNIGYALFGFMACMFLVWLVAFCSTLIRRSR